MLARLNDTTWFSERDNDFVALLECVIGVEQYQRFEDSHTIGDVERFVLLLQEAMGETPSPRVAAARALPRS